MYIRKPPYGEQNGRKHQGITQDYPNTVCRRRPWQLTNDRRKGNEHDIRVKERHKTRNCCVDYDDVFVIQEDLFRHKTNFQPLAFLRRAESPCFSPMGAKSKQATRKKCKPVR